MTQIATPSIWSPEEAAMHKCVAASHTRLERLYFEKYVLEVCIATIERGGVTSKIDTHQFFSSSEAWGIPKYPDKTVILLPGTDLPYQITTFISLNEACLREPDCWLGTWINPGTGNCYLDITAIYSCLEDARREAVLLSQNAQRKIVALYDFKHEETVYLSW
ncbi:MAG TPA: hypothetical protein VII61_20415 [Ktedonobacteraceae bacterium]|jgi:hypothetical protein